MTSADFFLPLPQSKPSTQFSMEDQRRHKEELFYFRVKNMMMKIPALKGGAFVLAQQRT